MEQDVVEGGLTGYRHVCSTCLSSDRNLISINDAAESFEVFRLLMFDFNSDRVSQYVDPLADIEHLFCWECVAVMRRLCRFKRQVHSAQEHLRVLALSRGQNLDHTYMAQTLSPLEMVVKTDYDKIFVDYTNRDLWQSQFIIQSMDSVKNEDFDVGQVVRDNIDLQAVELMDVPVMAALTEPVSSVMSHIVVDSGMLLPAPCASETKHSAQLEVAVDPHSLNKSAVISQRANPAVKCGYIADCMSETEMQAYREEEKQKVQYACAAYKCELCIVGFYSQQQVEDHFIAFHRAKPGLVPCKVCYVYIDEASLALHTERHYTRYICKLCGHIAPTDRQASQHVKSHSQSMESGVINIEPAKPRRRKKKGGGVSAAAAPGDLRKLLSKTTIEGYKCLECEMFFKTSRARKNHVARFHREGLQCDHCKKRFVNRTTLATHLRLHEGPLPREECPVCHKMVRSIQIKYHIQRHKNKTRYECAECQKIFSHLATYQAHLKYARAHASDEIFKFPCPMCNKGFPTKEQMQDHFNYQHLGKTQHKCPVCEKPIASRANVEKHMMRVHGEKKDKPRNHSCAHCGKTFTPIASRANVEKHMMRVHGEKKDKPRNHSCAHCGKTFTDKKALTQHEVIHSGERPLSCDICQQTFKQKASLYTHRKRVHKVYPQKRHVEYMDVKLE